jgi:hypothetical protein
MGCGFPKEFNLDAIDYEEMRDLIENAWSKCVPKYVARAYAEGRDTFSVGAAVHGEQLRSFVGS